MITNPDICILTNSIDHSPWELDLASNFSDEGYTTRWSSLDESPPKGEFLVSLLDTEDALIVGLSEDTYPIFQRYIEQAQESKILWVTQSTSLACADAGCGLIHGFARTLRAELLLDISVLEVPAWDKKSAKAVVQVCQKIQKARGHSLPDPEYEFALHDGNIKVGRYHWTPLVEQLTSLPRPNAARKLTLTAYGLLDTLQWVHKDQSELAAGEVEVQMEYVGLNFKVGFFL